MNKQFQGIYAVVVTPFHEDGTFDVESAKKNLDWLIEQGVQGVCILGATGEYQSISDEEHMAYVKEIVPYVKDRVSVIVGASRERPEDVVKLVNNIKECGAHAAMVLPSFYCHPAQDEIVEHYRYIEEQTQFPIVAYCCVQQSWLRRHRDRTGCFPADHGAPIYRDCERIQRQYAKADRSTDRRPGESFCILRMR